MTAPASGQLARLADTLAERLAAPTAQDSGDQRGQAQSLARGAAGVALLHIERAHTGVGSWRSAHTWVTAATRGEISAADSTGLYFGVPALAFMLHAAGADQIPRYGPALRRLHVHVSRLAHRRVDAALARLDRGEMATFAEYDLLRGLTGLGQLLLRHTPGSEALGRILGYLVRLPQPFRTDSGTVPGWWVCHAPHIQASPAFPGGHANLGLAHGITGVLAFLGTALRRGITVDGHAEAIAVICAHLDTWRHDGEPGPWWPQWITQDEWRTGRVRQRGPLRPSWCYGTPGIARAQQIAALATCDITRRRIAEHALTACLADPAQLARITDAGLCHGWSGLYQTAWRAARDALTPAISTQLPDLLYQLTRQGGAQHHGDSTGFLDGTAGLALALHTAAHDAPPTPDGTHVC